MGAAFDGSMPEVKVFTNPRTGVQQILNPGHLHPAVLEVATHPFLLSIVENYLRNRIFLADWDMRRVPPMSMAELDQRAHTGSVGYTSSHWHRDIRGHQVKVMIYLTDVTEKDNNFAFLPGTHKGFQTRPSRVEESRYSDEYVCNHPVNAVECYGPAGTTLVFDTNPIHRLRRKAGASVRDSITFYYTPGQELRELGLPANATSLMGPRVAALFGGERLSR
jgi:ectoine hydroxylase-related dioxygenase (phytanoyl-CoA dioxygenase family)